MLGCRVGVGAGIVAEGGTGEGMAATWVLLGCGLRVAGGRTGKAVADAVGEAVGVTLGVLVGVIVRSAVGQ